jgi:very-short-patch-repair endonuclease
MLVSHDDVVACGGGRHHIDARVHGGRWLQIERGVYLLAGAPVDWEARELAAVLAAGPGAGASHLAAARLWGLPGFDRAGRELSIPRGRRDRRPGIRTHESTDLDRAGVVLRSRIPTTGPDRTILDLGRYLGVLRLRRAAEDARRADLVSWASLIQVLLAHARGGRPGIRRLRTVILHDADRKEVTDTDHEFLVLGLIREAGLPEPELHFRVMDGSRFVAEVDMAYPSLKIAIECDGSVHLLPEVHERDLARQNDLVLLGWTVIRFSWERVRARPDVVAREVRAAIEAVRRSRQAKPAADSPGLPD